MKVDLYIAASLEGFIADEHGGSDWVCDDELFAKTSRQYGCICLGHTTFTQFEGKLYPMKDVENIVLTHKPPKKTKYKNVHFVTSIEDAMDCAQKLGFKKLLVIGGAKTNQSFMQAGVVHKVFTDIHPILLEKGLPMFGAFKAKFDFKMLNHQWHDTGFMHAEYSVGKIRKGADPKRAKELRKKHKEI